MLSLLIGFRARKKRNLSQTSFALRFSCPEIASGKVIAGSTTH